MKKMMAIFMAIIMAFSASVMCFATEEVEEANTEVTETVVEEEEEVSLYDYFIESGLASWTNNWIIEFVEYACNKIIVLLKAYQLILGQYKLETVQ